ncbi:hypothetical protein GCM10019059_33180 [Camelimonas fluminis]|nr:hypothetical protein GCM10019059_33180 [Camelimonas fluminis]
MTPGGAPKGRRKHAFPHLYGAKPFKIPLTAIYEDGLLLALIDIPDFSGLFGRMANALERLAGTPSPESDPAAPASPDAGGAEVGKQAASGAAEGGHA